MRSLIRLARVSDSSASATRITGRMGDTKLAIHALEFATWTWQRTRMRFGEESGRRLRVTPLSRRVERGQEPEWLDQRRRLAVYLFSLEHGGMMAEIDEFFVIPEKRSLSIGSALLSVASQTMAEERITHVQLQLNTQNPNGKRFYERHEFRFLSGYDVLTKSLASST